MSDIFFPKQGWGPDGKRCALSITFDNFGEAADLELGSWDGAPLGRHYTAAWLPTLIDALGEIRATYFVEAMNAELYPDALRLWQNNGHEIGIHGWRHENWAKCDSSRRITLLRQSMEALRAIGIHPKGFRPPGGAIPPEAWDEFQSVGLEYCSNSGSAGIRPVGHLLSLPFEWQGVDVYMLEDIVAFLRRQQGDSEQAYTLGQWQEHLDHTLERVLEEGGQRTLIFHPHFLAHSAEKLDVLKRLLDRVREDSNIWVAPTYEVASFAAQQLRIS